jgi:hypothetical protein
MDSGDQLKDSSTSSVKSTSMLLRLQEEAQAPFRKFRMFIYGGAFFSCVIGLFVSSSQLLSGIRGTSTAYPVKDSIYNIVINSIVIVTASLLYFYDYGIGKRRLDKLSAVSYVRKLPVEYDSKQYFVAELERKCAVLIVASTEDQLRTILYKLKNISMNVEKFIVIPYAINSSTPPSWVEFRDCKWLARVSNSSSWYSWYLKEREFVPKTKVGEPIVLLLRKSLEDFRGYGNPNWANWISSIK